MKIAESSEPNFADTIVDKAGVEYWNNVWQAKAKAKYNPEAPSNRELTSLLKYNLSNLPVGSIVMELGCADSVILPYVHSLGYATVGLDYSELGCKKFAEQSPHSKVICSDFFNPPEELLESADAILSFGLIEHFSDTKNTVQAMLKLLKPGGIIINIVPNMYGSVGLLQRVLNRAAFDVHVRLTPSDLAHAHSDLVEVKSGYLSAIGYGVVNHGYRLPARAIISALGRASTWLMRIDKYVRLPRTRAFSPHCYCTGIKRSSPIAPCT